MIPSKAAGRLRVAALGSIIASLSALGAVEAAPPKSDPAAEAMALEKKVLDAVNEGDKATIEALLSDDFRDVSAEGRKNKADILKTVAAIPVEQRSKTFDMQAQLLTPEVVIVTYRIGAEEKSEEALWFSSVWARRDGRWLNVFSQTSNVTPQPPPDVPASK